MTHAQQMAAIINEIHSPTCVALADRMLESKIEAYRDLVALREILVRKFAKSINGQFIPPDK